ALLQSHVPGLWRRPGDVRRSDQGRIFATKPLAKLQIRIRHARLCVSPRNLAAYRSTDGKAGLGYGMAYEGAVNDRSAAPTEMMPRFAFRNERKRFRCNQYGCNFLRHTWQRGNRDNKSEEVSMCVPKTLSVRRRI